MKIFIPLCYCFITFLAKAQTQKVLINNDDVTVTQFISRPGAGVCGKGIHHHPPHLTVLLTNTNVKITEHGKTTIQKTPAGTVF